LLLADAVSDNKVIPDYDHLVIDEAHHLEEAITTSLSVRIEGRKQLSNIVWDT